MKHLNYFLAIALVLVIAISFGFAGKGSGVTLPSSQIQKVSDETRTPQMNREEAINAGEIRVRSDFSKAGRSLSSLSKETYHPEAYKQSVPPGSPLSGGMSGTYHIPGDFPDIRTAVAVVNFAGVSGNTVWLLDAT